MERSAAGRPDAGIEVPRRVAELAGGDRAVPVWRNELGGLTFRVRGERGTRYIKWQRTDGLDGDRLADVDLAGEAARLRWAGRFIRVPEVIDAGADEGERWLVTAAVDAVSAVDPRWRGEPEVAVRAIAEGLRRMHDALPVDECPFAGTWLGEKAREAPEPERLVVCHGDPCVPNTLMDDRGGFAAHVDLSRLGVADRWADLAIATYSIGWGVNFGTPYDDLFWEAYGVEPDRERIRAYRELWDAD